MGVESVRGARRELLNGWTLCDTAVFGAFHGYTGEEFFTKTEVSGNARFAWYEGLSAWNLTIPNF